MQRSRTCSFSFYREEISNGESGNQLLLTWRNKHGGRSQQKCLRVMTFMWRLLFLENSQPRFLAMKQAVEFEECLKDSPRFRWEKMGLEFDSHDAWGPGRALFLGKAFTNCSLLYNTAWCRFTSITFFSKSQLPQWRESFRGLQICRKLNLRKIENEIVHSLI